MSTPPLPMDAVPRGAVRVDADAPFGRTPPRLLGCVVLFGLLYGAVMGGFGGVGGERVWQVVYSAVKVPLLLIATCLISLPSFVALNLLLGVRDDLPLALRAVTATQASLTVLLASLAPFTALWYASFADYGAAQLFNAAMFAVASAGAQWQLRRCYRPLIARHAAHRLLLRAWLFIFGFVGIQMGWVLRPFVGAPDIPTRFFRENAWSNAYVFLWDLLTR